MGRGLARGHGSSAVEDVVGQDTTSVKGQRYETRARQGKRESMEDTTWEASRRTRQAAGGIS